MSQRAAICRNSSTSGPPRRLAWPVHPDGPGHPVPEAIAMRRLVTASLLALAALAFGAACRPAPAPHSGVGLRLPPGDADRGAAVYARLECHRCHDLDGDGATDTAGTPVRLGGTVTRVRTHGELVTAVIHPQHDISRPLDDDSPPRMPGFNDRPDRGGADRPRDVPARALRASARTLLRTLVVSRRPRPSASIAHRRATGLRTPGDRAVPQREVSLARALLSRRSGRTEPPRSSKERSRR